MTKMQLPTLEKAKEITNRFKRPLGQRVLLINCVAPSVTTGGVNISEGLQKQHQSKINRQGMLVVQSPFTNPIKNDFEVIEGEKVIYAIGAQAELLTTVRSNELIDGLELEEGKEPSKEMYKQYVVMIMSIHNLAVVVD